MIEREMTASWTEWQGMVVDGTFYLDRYLGGTEGSAVYLTDWGEENKPAAIKLIAADADAESHLLRWKLASELNHPNLLRIYQAGRCELDGVRLLYVVMEYAEENLAEILRERPLNADEAREMTAGVLEALAALHYKGLVHGQVKPSNIMASGDQLKISSDSVAHAGSRAACDSAYDAPELANEPLSPSADIWSLGMTLVEALTQQRPGIIGADGELELSAELPAPFQEIAQHCLMSDLVRRWTVAGIRAHLLTGQGVPQGAKVADSAMNSTASTKAAPDSTTAPSQGPEAPLPDWVAEAANAPAIWETVKPYVPVTLAALVFFATTATLFTMNSSRRGQGRKTVSAAVSAKAQPATKASEAARSQSTITDRQPKLDIVSAGFSGTSSATQSAAQSATQAQPTQASWVEAFSPQPEAMSTSLSGRLVPGAAIERPLPEVPARARRTIHGRVKVKVRVAVDPSGSVQSAILGSRPSSRYFAGLAMETARRWRFSPAQMNGQNVASEWLLKFEFRRGRTDVHPSPLTAADRRL